MTWVDDVLVPLDACNDAVAWARTHEDFAAAWAACPRGDWLLWYAGRCIRRSGGNLHRQVVRAALACAREAWPQAKEQDRAVVQACYDATQAWVDDGGDIGAVCSAADAAYAAAAYSAYADYAAYAADAVYAAADAAYAAADAAYDAVYAAAYAADAAYDADYAAAYTMHAAYAAAAFHAGPRAAMQRRTADIVRATFPVPPQLEQEVQP